MAISEVLNVTYICHLLFIIYAIWWLAVKVYNSNLVQFNKLHLNKRKLLNNGLNYQFLMRIKLQFSVIKTCSVLLIICINVLLNYQMESH